MRNTLKRTLSLVLAVLMLASVAVTAFAAEQTVLDPAHKYMENLEYAMEYFEGPDEFNEPIPRKTYYFIMPEEWKNEHNAWYDGTNLDSCVAGIYWYGATAQPKDYQPFYASNDWPGYAVLTKDEAGVYVASIPADVTTVIWNNTVDGGMDSTLPIYKAARQTEDLSTTGYDGSDPYGFYPDGIPTDPGCDGMVYVIDPAATKVNPHSGVTTYGGAWFYYYGNGEYGTAKTKEEAGEFVYSGGYFPASKIVVKPDPVEIGVGGTATLTSSKTNVKVEVADSSIATVTATNVAGEYTVKGLAAGTTTAKFTVVDENGVEVIDPTTQEAEADTVTITVTQPTLDRTSLSMKVGDIDFLFGIGFGDTAKWTSSNKAVATVDNFGMVTAKGNGTATITVKQGDQKATCKVTVKSNAKLNKTKASLKAGATVTLSVKGKAAGSKVTWTSSNPKVATVKNGKVTALKKGKVTITAKCENKKLTCTVNVTTSPKLSKATASVKKGGKVVITVTGAATKVTVAKTTVAKFAVKGNKITVTGTKKGTKKTNVKVNGVTLKLKVVVK